MSIAIICGLVCMVAYGVASLFGTFASRSNSPLLASIWSYAIAGVVALVLLPTRHIPWASLSPIVSLFLLAASLCMVSAFFLSNYSYTHGNASAHQTIVSSSSAIVVILAVIFIGEHLRPTQWAALALTFFGALLCSVNFKRLRAGGRPGLSTVAAIVSALLYGVGNAMNKYVVNHTGWYLDILIIVIIGLSTLLVVARRQRRRLWPRKGHANLLWYGLLTGVTSYIEVYGYAAGPASIVAVLVTASIIVFAIIAHFKLKDRISHSQVAGIVITFAGITTLVLLGR